MPVNAPLAVTIPAPPETRAAEILTQRAMNSAKGGEVRCDAAAPPTAATCPGTFSFADLLDTINPLQHIPGVNLAYQAISGDKIAAPANIAGGALYGGILGGLSAMVLSLVDELSAAGTTTPTPQIADESPARPAIFKAG